MYRNKIPATLLVALASFTSASANANWQVYKFLDVGLSTTDSLQFSENDELFYSARPSVELSFDGNRFNTDIGASVEFYHFNEQDTDVVDPRLEVITTGALVDGLLYINSSLEVGKIFTDGDPFDLNESSEPNARIQINPFFARQIGRFTDFYFGFGHQSLDNEVDGDFDFQQDTLGFTLNRNPRFGGFLWGVGGSYDKSRVNEEGFSEDFESSSVYASLGSTVGQSLYFELVGGQETTGLEALGRVENTSTFLEARLNWTPSERTSLTVGFSDRFYGEGPTFSFSHELQNSILSATWTRGINNAEVSLDSVSPFNGVADSLIPTGPDLINLGNATSQRLFVDERLSLEYKRAGRRSDFIVDAVYSDQQELGGELTRVQAVGRIAFDRHLSPLTTLRLQYEHLIDEDINDVTSSENRVGVRLIYNFDRKERVSILAEES